LNLLFLLMRLCEMPEKEFKRCVFLSRRKRIVFVGKKDYYFSFPGHACFSFS